MARVVLERDGTEVCGRCAIADRPHTRLRGLLGRRGLDEDEGLLLRPASSIHTFFMRFAIDAVFLDRDGVVVGVAPDLPPWRAAARRRSKAVLELPAGALARLPVAVGDRVTIVR